jgi:feruloyl-CoA synthase
MAALPLAPREVLVEPRAGGGFVLRSPQDLLPYPRHVSVPLRRWAAEAPGRTFLAERAGEGGFRTLTYGEAREQVDRLAQALLDRGLGPEAPLMILSDNGIDHALLTLGAMQAGVPASPISPAYSLQSKDFAKLRAIAAALAPGLCYASESARYGRALSALGLRPAQVVTGDGGFGASLAELLTTAPRPEMERRYAELGPDAVAKVLFTSGSTGQPKGVINTQRMLCSNQQSIAQAWPFLAQRPPVVLDWLPWSHTFGANHNFGLVLFNGGTLTIDDGKPTPELLGRTLRNLREVSPTMYFNVPRGFDLLVPELEADGDLARAFFRDLDVLFYAAASLSGPMWERLEALSERARGERVLMLSAWGSTETAPMATTVHWEIRRAGVIGLPGAGTRLKLVPSGSKLELRVAGPNVTPGYWRRPDLTAAAFDEEGFFRMGDGGKLADPERPELGVLFDGRIAEDFKLASATWVHTGAVRLAVLAAAAPVAQDVAVAGLDREEIGLLVFPNAGACRALCGGSAEPIEALLGRDEVRSALRESFARYNAEHPAGSQRIGRLLLVAEPPSIDAGEITDKGYLNQRAVLERRAALVDRLYAERDGDVLVLA